MRRWPGAWPRGPNPRRPDRRPSVTASGFREDPGTDFLPRVHAAGVAACRVPALVARGGRRRVIEESCRNSGARGARGRAGAPIGMEEEAFVGTRRDRGGGTRIVAVRVVIEAQPDRARVRGAGQLDVRAV